MPWVRSGQTPLDFARFHGRAEVARLLEDAEAWLMRRTGVPLGPHDV